MTTPFLFVPAFSWPAAPGGKLHTYAAGGTTPQGTWSDAAGTVPNTNPVTLDSNGLATIRLTAGQAYHFVLKDSTDTTTLWDEDNYQSSYLTVSDIGGLLYPRTSAESSAGVTPTNYAYPPLHAFRYLSSAQVSDAQARTATLDCSAALNNLLAVARQGSGPQACYLPSGTYLIQANPLNLTNMQAAQITLYGDSHGTGLYSTSSTSGTVLYGKTGTQAVIEALGSHYVTLRDFQIVTLTSDANRSVVGILMGRTTVQNSAQLHSYQRLAITLASNGTANAGRGTIGIYNMGAEHDVHEQIAINADVCVYMEAANSLGYTPTYGTLSFGTCALHEYRQCAFVSTSNPCLILSGVQALMCLDCYYGTVSGSYQSVAVNVTNLGAGVHPENLFFLGGQVEHWNTFIQVGDDTIHTTIDLLWGCPSATGPFILANVNNNQILAGWDVRFRNNNANPINMFGVGASTGVTVTGGRFVLDAGVSCSANLIANGVSIEDENPTVPVTVSFATGSIYSVRNVLNTPGATTKATLTLNGVTGTHTVTATIASYGGGVTIHVPSVSGPASGTSVTLTGIPSQFQPASATFGYANVLNNSANAAGEWGITAGTLSLYVGLTRTGTSFAGTGTQGWNDLSISYPLN